METGTTVNRYKIISAIGKGGISLTPGIKITPYEQSYIYTVRRDLIDLYLADGWT